MQIIYFLIILNLQTSFKIKELKTLKLNYKNNNKKVNQLILKKIINHIA